MFRKAALDAMKQEIPFDNKQNLYIASIDSSLLNTVAIGVNLFQLVKNEKDEKDLYFFAENLQVRKDFKIFGIYENTLLPTFSDTIYQRTIKRLYNPDMKVEDFMNEHRFILTKDNKKRKTYGHTEADTKEVYEHSVILLPMKKREKLIVIRDNEK